MVRVHRTCIALLVSLLASCGTERPAETDPESEAEKAEVARCIAREIHVVAPQPVDLETATLAVMTRCHWGETVERRYVAAYPEYRDFIHGVAQKQYREMAESVKGQIAVARTHGSGK